jgi:hypothetical protein
MNSLHNIMASMTTGKYIGIVGTRGQVYAGRVNGIMKEDGSGRNWLVTLNTKSNGTKTVFVKAS